MAGAGLALLAALTLAAQPPEVTIVISQREIDDTIGEVSAYLRSHEPT